VKLQVRWWAPHALCCPSPACIMVVQARPLQLDGIEKASPANLALIALTLAAVCTPVHRSDMLLVRAHPVPDGEKLCPNSPDEASCRGAQSVGAFTTHDAQLLLGAGRGGGHSSFPRCKIYRNPSLRQQARYTASSRPGTGATWRSVWVTPWPSTTGINSPNSCIRMQTLELVQRYRRIHMASGSCCSRSTAIGLVLGS
jgi:hypothetical protein